MTGPEIVERVCRALAYQTGQSDDWEPWDRHARSAILALLEAVHEPSEAMTIAGQNWLDWLEINDEERPWTMNDGWRAMVDALKREIAQQQRGGRDG